MFLVLRGFLLSLFTVPTLCGFSITPTFHGDRNPVANAIDAVGNIPIFSTVSQDDSAWQKPDLYYECQLAEIGRYSPIDFDYNPHVKRYIDLFIVERRDQFSKIIGLADYYFPLFDEVLSKYNLPLELKYLAVVESALNPLAISPTGAVGLWQFKINTSKMFNLQVNNFVDERMDPLKSTEAAAMYLQYLFQTFNDWSLALAAYNVGPGPIRNAMERSNGEKNFWKLYPLLPESAQNYVPAYIAAAYVMNNYREHGISPSPVTIPLSKTDTILVGKPIDLNLLAKEIDVDISIIRFLNPTYRYDYIPESKNLQVLRLPIDKTALFIRKSKELYLNTRKPKALPESKTDSTLIRTIYTVKSGDSLHKLAIHFGCTLNDIYRWNPGLDSTIAAGQDIIFWINPNDSERVRALQ